MNDMTAKGTNPNSDDGLPGVSKHRYDRERCARQDAEQLLEASRCALHDANLALQQQQVRLEKAEQRHTDELATARCEVQAADAAKLVLVASVSHEFKTPLNGVLGMAAALTDSDLTAVQAELVQGISDSGNDLLSVVNDILDLTKVESGKLEMTDQVCSVNKALENVFQHYAPLIRDKGLSFTNVSSGMLAAGEVWAKFDSARLGQVLDNLLSNAIKFTNGGGVALTADLVASENEQLQLNITIRDTGIGISAQAQRQMFLPFTQTHASITQLQGGIGLGLALARQICRLMGGDVTCLSAKGDGAEFCASFRMAPAPLAAVINPDQIAEHEAIVGGGKWRVLVAEDNKTNQLVLKHMLKRYELDLVMRADGEQLVQEWRSHGADLILMDVNMPVLDGLSATQMIRAQERNSDSPPVPIIAISANSMLHQVGGYLQRGLTAHVAKPIRKAELLRAMALALGANVRSPIR